MFMRKIVEPPRRDYRCISAKIYWGEMTTQQPDELNDKAEPSEYLEVPWIVCKIPSKPCAMKRSSTSVLTCLHLVIKLLYWLILLPIKGIKRLLGG